MNKETLRRMRIKRIKKNEGKIMFSGETEPLLDCNLEQCETHSSMNELLRKTKRGGKHIMKRDIRDLSIKYNVSICLGPDSNKSIVK